MKIDKKFYWGTQTIKNFIFTANNQSKEEVINKITLFVKNQVDIVFPVGKDTSMPKENVTEEILINDLTNQVYNKQ